MALTLDTLTFAARGGEAKRNLLSWWSMQSSKYESANERQRLRGAKFKAEQQQINNEGREQILRSLKIFEIKRLSFD
jgi:hypothetical protein